MKSEDERIREMYARLSEKITIKDKKNWESELESIRKDPNSPLCSEFSFEDFNLKPEILEGLKVVRFNKPTKFQETVLPLLVNDPPCDVIAQSQSSTGKTAAIIIAMLNRVDTTKMHPQVLFLLPTFELLMQVGPLITRIKSRLAIYMAFAECAIGHEQVIMGTPEQIYKLWRKDKIDVKKINVFAVDEADYMIMTPGFWDKCSEIQKQLSPICQMILVSTTFDHSSMEIARSIVKNPIVKTLSPEQQSLDNITQIYVHCYSQDDKYKAIYNINELLWSVNTKVQALIFCNTNETAQQLYENIKQTNLYNRKDAYGQDYCSVHIITNGLFELDGGFGRYSKLSRFHCNYKMLITTNTLSRGIHFASIGVVMNFDLPLNQSGEADYNTYLNRIGRAGRFGKKGIAINLIDSEKSMKLCKAIEKHFQKEIHLLEP